jgi:hypothetical protein
MDQQTLCGTPAACMLCYCFLVATLLLLLLL